MYFTSWPAAFSSIFSFIPVFTWSMGWYIGCLLSLDTTHITFNTLHNLKPAPHEEPSLTHVKNQRNPHERPSKSLANPQKRSLTEVVVALPVTTVPSTVFHSGLIVISVPKASLGMLLILSTAKR